MIREHVSLPEAPPYAMAQAGPMIVWMITLVLAMWGLVRLRHPIGLILWPPPSWRR